MSIISLQYIICSSRFIGSPEFYIILLLIAAAIVIYMARPTGVGPATEHLLAAKLRQDFCIDMDREAGIEIDCDEAGTVWLRRTGLKDVDLTGAVSAKIEVKGFNITVRERITPGKYGDQPVDSALFELDFLASERYYLRYEAESISMSATLAFRNTAGYHASAVLRR